MKRKILLMLTLSLFAAFFCSAQNERKNQIDELRSAGSPGDGHRILDQLEGRWKVRGFVRITEDANPEMVSGTAKLNWILGKRFLQQDFNCSKVDLVLHGLGILGYDKLQNEYVGIWCDSANTGIASLSGKLASGGEGIVFQIEQTDLRSGKRVEGRAEILFNPNGGFRYSVFMQSGSEWIELVRLDYKRG